MGKEQIWEKIAAEADFVGSKARSYMKRATETDRQLALELLSQMEGLRKALEIVEQTEED